MLRNPLKPKSIRKELTGKRVVIKSHASPALRKRVGTIVDVVKCAKYMVIELEPIKKKVIHFPTEFIADKVVHLGAPAKTVVIPREGLEFA